VAKVRLYMDEHVPKAVVRGLRQRGVDVATVVDAGAMGAPDLDHLRSAQRQGRAIFAQDDDFPRLAACGDPHAGIVYAPQHTSIRAMIQGLTLVHSVLDAEEIAGRSNSSSRPWDQVGCGGEQRGAGVRSVGRNATGGSAIPASRAMADRPCGHPPYAGLVGHRRFSGAPASQGPGVHAPPAWPHRLDPEG